VLRLYKEQVDSLSQRLQQPGAALSSAQEAVQLRESRAALFS